MEQIKITENDNSAFVILAQKLNEIIEWINSQK